MPTTDTGVTLDMWYFCQDSGTYSAEYDSETTTPTMAVITALTEILDVHPTSLPPLQYSIDTEAMDDFFCSHDDTESPAQLSFSFVSHEVTVASNGKLTVTPEDSAKEVPVEKRQSQA